MTRHPALALLEFDSVAAGIAAADAMTKQAPIALLRCGTVHPGRYLVLLGGSVASVQEAHALGVQFDFLAEEVLLPDVHEQVYDAALGSRRDLEAEALGVLETTRAPAILHASDAAVKGADVDIAEIRFSDDLGGRAFAFFDGPLHEVEAALEIGSGRLQSEQVVACRLLPRLDDNLRQLLVKATRFGEVEGLEPEGAEESHVSG
jgi:microcompartment protein CcmL/EutN